MFQISGVTSDYQVNVLASGYNNLYNRCASCRNSSSQPLGCCNTLQLNSTLAAASCPALPDCEVSIVTCLGTIEMGNTTNVYDEATTEANFRSYGRREYISRLCGNQFHTSYVTTANYQTWESHMDLNGISPEYKVNYTWSVNLSHQIHTHKMKRFCITLTHCHSLLLTKYSIFPVHSYTSF